MFCILYVWWFWKRTWDYQTNMSCHVLKRWEVCVRCSSKELVESTWLIQSINPSFLQLIIPNETREESSKIQTCLRFAIWKSYGDHACTPGSPNLWQVPWTQQRIEMMQVGFAETFSGFTNEKNDGRRKRSLHFYIYIYVLFIKNTDWIMNHAK